MKFSRGMKSEARDRERENERAVMVPVRMLERY